MEKRTPFFLTSLLKRPQKSESSEEKGWGNTIDDTTFNGWGSPPGSIGLMTNGWADEPPESHYNGWGSGSLSKLPGVETSSNGWTYDKPKDELNGWGSGSGSGGKCTTPETSSNGWMKIKPLEDGCNGWSSVGQSATSKASSNIWMNELPTHEPVSKPVEVDVGTTPILESRPFEVESWAPSLVPSAPPLPEEGYEHCIAKISDRLYFDSIEKEAVSMNESKNSDALCVVCWETRVEGACVPCGHMASCMSCLHEIESKQGSCPICRAKIDKVMRIYAISTK